MKLTTRELAAALASSAVGCVALVSIVEDSWHLAAACGVVLQVLTIALVLLASRRRAPAPKAPPAIDPKALQRIERAIENVSLRVVTESEATRRELGERRD